MIARTFIIAEVGVNHNGSTRIAKKLIKQLAKLDIDAIKIQAFTADKLVSANSELAKYQSANTNKFNNQYEMLKEYELSIEEIEELADYARKIGVTVFSSVFSLSDYKKIESLGNNYIKIPSGEFTNYQLIDIALNKYKEVILSTGLSDMNEIIEVISWIKKKREGLEGVSILHCTSAYPCPSEDVDINSISTIANKFNVKVGFSDHTIGNVASIMAISQGALIIEKHVTLDKQLEGPDHKASQDMDEFAMFTKQIREAEKMLGNGNKEIQKSAKENFNIVKKSIYALQDINKGDKFSDKNLITLRPAGGIDSRYIAVLEGKNSKDEYKKGDLISKKELPSK